MRARYAVFASLFLAGYVAVAADPPSPHLRRWLGPQEWVRDLDRPVLSLGPSGSFDDRHIFAPCVAHENGRFRMWYCGSRGVVAERVFKLGLATSRDGVRFEWSPKAPVFEFGDGRRSVLTPTLLRRPDGSVLRESGKLRMWFSATDFRNESGLHTLHQTTSADGIHWTAPSPPQLPNVYAPTILKEKAAYRMWYADVGKDPWTIRHATSSDGRSRVESGFFRVCSLV